MIQNNNIPDSIDMLALNGITGFDAKAYIYGKKSEFQMPKTPDKVDTFEKKDNNRNWKTFSNVFLGGLTIATLAIVFRKKLPQMGKVLKENVQKLFKKH